MSNTATFGIEMDGDIFELPLKWENERSEGSWTYVRWGFDGSFSTIGFGSGSYEECVKKAVLLSNMSPVGIYDESRNLHTVLVDEVPHKV